MERFKLFYEGSPTDTQQSGVYVPDHHPCIASGDLDSSITIQLCQVEIIGF